MGEDMEEEDDDDDVVVVVVVVVFIVIGTAAVDLIIASLAYTLPNAPVTTKVSSWRSPQSNLLPARQLQVTYKG